MRIVRMDCVDVMKTLETATTISTLMDVKPIYSQNKIAEHVATTADRMHFATVERVCVL